MAALIDCLISLDLDKPYLQRTNIVLNQANKDSVVFNIRIYKNDTEIDYSQLTHAELVFQKPDKSNVVDDAALGANGITYTLRAELFDVTGMVTGYANLYSGEEITATLHYNFMLISDLLNYDAVSNTYISAVEKFLIEMRRIYALMEIILAEAENITQKALDEVREQIDAALKSANDAINEAYEIIKQAWEILEALRNDAFATIEYVDSKTANMAVKDGTLQVNLNAEMLDGMKSSDFTTLAAFEEHLASLLPIHKGRNDEPNKIVRTDGTGYLPVGFINSNIPPQNQDIANFITDNGDGYFRKSGIASVIENLSPKVSTKIGLARKGRLSAAALQNTHLSAGIYTNFGDGLLNSNGSGYAFTGWWHVIVMEHMDANGHGVQLAFPLNMESPSSIYWRRAVGQEGWIEWMNIITTTGGVVNGKLTVDRPTEGWISQGGSINTLEIKSANGNAAGISFHRNGYHAVNFGLDPDNQLRVGGWSMGVGNSYTITHHGNLASHLAQLPAI